MFNFCYDWYVFFCNRFLGFQCLIYIVDRLYVEYDDALLNRQSAWSAYTSGCFIDQHNFITHRIYFIKKMKFQTREFFNVLLQCFNCLYIWFLDSDNGLWSTNCLHNRMESFHNLICMFFKQLSMKFQQWFTLGTVQKNCVRLVCKLGIWRESGTTCTYNTIVLHNFL